MKKTSEALTKAQEKALIYREKLETGEIRLVPERKPRTQKQEDEIERTQARQ